MAFRLLARSCAPRPPGCRPFISCSSRSAPSARLLHDSLVGEHARPRRRMDTINEEVQGLDLAYQPRRPAGAGEDDRAAVAPAQRQPLSDRRADGRILTGNVESLEPGVIEIEGWTERPFSYQRYGEANRRRREPAASGDPAQCHRAGLASAQPDDRSRRPRPRRAGTASGTSCARRWRWRSA